MQYILIQKYFCGNNILMIVLYWAIFSVSMLWSFYQLVKATAHKLGWMKRSFFFFQYLKVSQSVASRWHFEKQAFKKFLLSSWDNVEAVCLNRSGTWRVESSNCRWPDTSAQFVVWQWAAAAPTCSPVEKISRWNVGIWSTTRYIVQISCVLFFFHFSCVFSSLLTVSDCLLGNQALPRTPQCRVWFGSTSNHWCACDVQQRRLSKGEFWAPCWTFTWCVEINLIRQTCSCLCLYHGGLFSVTVSCLVFISVLLFCRKLSRLWLDNISHISVEIKKRSL